MGRAMTAAERVISADSHVALRHEQVKVHLKELDGADRVTVESP